MAACKEETARAIADAEYLLGKTLANDAYYGTLVQTWVDADAVNRAQDALVQVMAAEEIVCDPHDDIACAFDTTDPDQACRAILRAYEIVSGIEEDDPDLWARYEEAFAQALDDLHDQVDGVDWDKIG